MGIFLNRGIEEFKKTLNSQIYVDKTDIIGFLNRVVNTEQSYICVSRPRRFGKSVTANMIAAYYEKGSDSRMLFDGKKLSEIDGWDSEMNKYNVIRIDIADILASQNDAERALDYIESKIIEELKLAFPDVLKLDVGGITEALASINEVTQEQFIIIIDEWDVFYRDEKSNLQIQNRYINLLRSLFKGNRSKKFIALAYITGILPIKKYNSESALNNFIEYTMISPKQMAPYIGFTEQEVVQLCDQYDMDYDKMQDWYDGYSFECVSHIYGPNSVVQSILGRSYENYWSQTVTFYSLSTYITMNFDGLREAVVAMLSGNRVHVNVLCFQNDMMSFQSKDDVLTILIHLGYLAYDREKQEAYIPNYEVRQIFEGNLMNTKWDSVIKAVQNSECLLKTTGTADSVVFRRSIVARLENFLASPKRVAALIGPWKCGKTFALKQLMAGKNNCIYYDCKSMSEQEKLGLFDNLIDYLQRYELIIIDEITYAEMPDVLLNKLANAIDGGTAKVIITGSQLVSIDYWVNMTMPTKCEKIYLCFLDFNEWVSFRGLDINSLSESDFLDYLQNSADFFGITDNKAYLEGCITETIISNKNAINIIPGNTELVPEEIDNIIAFLFVNFIKLHARVNWEFHLDPKRIATKIWDNVKDSHGIKYTQFIEEFCREFNKQHSFFSKITLENLREYLRFLIKIDFITITDGLGDCTKLQRWLWGVGEAPIDNVVAFYKRYTVQVKYPMFYYNFLREFVCFGETTLKDYNNSVVMGSALECYVRGLISYETESCVMDEFAPDTGGEIDYVDKTNLKALGTDGFGKCIKRVYEKSTQKKITRWKIIV